MRSLYDQIGFTLVFQVTLCLAIDESQMTLGDNSLTFSTAAASIGLLLMLCAVVLFMCTDCYNSEVDSTNHPACRGTKGGTGGNYYPANTEVINDQVLQSSFQTNDYVTPSSNTAPLPYTMIPTHIPEQSGFTGYQTEQTGNPGGVAGYQAPPAGLVGYGEVPATAPLVTGRHVNPMEPEEPPPPYREALQGYR